MLSVSQFWALVHSPIAPLSRVSVQEIIYIDVLLSVSSSSRGYNTYNPEIRQKYWWNSFTDILIEFQPSSMVMEILGNSFGILFELSAEAINMKFYFEHEIVIYDKPNLNSIGYSVKKIMDNIISIFFSNFSNFFWFLWRTTGSPLAFNRPLVIPIMLL